jgi:hypothetical protein
MPLAADFCNTIDLVPVNYIYKLRSARPTPSSCTFHIPCMSIFSYTSKNPVAFVAKGLHVVT